MSTQTNFFIASGSAHSARLSQNPKSKPKTIVADSWEDESVSSESSAEEGDGHETSSAGFLSSQRHHGDGPHLERSAQPSQWSPPTPQENELPQRRPEKQTAVASRIISHALGVRTKRTEEQRAYDRTVIENERKKRERERELEKQKREEEEKAKQAIWES